MSIVLLNFSLYYIILKIILLLSMIIITKTTIIITKTSLPTTSPFYSSSTPSSSSSPTTSSSYPPSYYSSSSYLSSTLLSKCSLPVCLTPVKGLFTERQLISNYHMQTIGTFTTSDSYTVDMMNNAILESAIVHSITVSLDISVQQPDYSIVQNVRCYVNVLIERSLSNDSTIFQVVQSFTTIIYSIPTAAGTIPTYSLCTITGMSGTCIPNLNYYPPVEYSLTGNIYMNNHWDNLINYNSRFYKISFDKSNSLCTPINYTPQINAIFLDWTLYKKGDHCKDDDN